jgi:hypothetical protein
MTLILLKIASQLILYHVPQLELSDVSSGLDSGCESLAEKHHRSEAMFFSVHPTGVSALTAKLLHHEAPFYSL